jgi:hypothetical protein
VYTNHHYVPQWYQRGFVAPDSRANVLYRLSLRPVAIQGPDGTRHELPNQRREPISKCFATADLYTLRFGATRSTAIEQLLFGEIDRRGSEAMAYWSAFEHPSADPNAFKALLRFMSTQKLRTPKGLDWLAAELGSGEPNLVLHAMTQLQSLYSSIWAECVWLLADATKSQTKFIVSDHPITAYNRACGPRHAFCRGASDPDIRLHGTHTIVPLNRERVLILTNLSWARDPYQSATAMRPNPTFYRDTIFNFFDTQTTRLLTEDEVRQINFIIKSRAYRQIAAGKPEWLYPEEYVDKSDWPTFGRGYLCMPDPRALHHGGETYVGYESGRSEGFDAFGRRPWEPDFGADGIQRGGRDPLLRFQGEFARLFGPARRGRSFQAGRLEDERDSEDFHQYHLDLERTRPRRHR